MTEHTMEQTEVELWNTKMQRYIQKAEEDAIHFCCINRKYPKVVYEVEK